MSYQTVLCRSNGTVTLGDFGLAVVLKNDGKTSGFAGTPAYAAPEVWNTYGRSIGTYGVEADIWSLGCTIYEMCVGSPPFTVKNIRGRQDFVSRLQDKILHYPTPELPRQISDELSSIIHSCLAKAPKDRPTIQALIESPSISLRLVLEQQRAEWKKKEAIWEEQEMKWKRHKAKLETQTAEREKEKAEWERLKALAETEYARIKDALVVQTERANEMLIERLEQQKKNGTIKAEFNAWELKREQSSEVGLLAPESEMSTHDDIWMLETAKRRLIRPEDLEILSAELGLKLHRKQLSNDLHRYRMQLGRQTDSICRCSGAVFASILGVPQAQIFLSNYLNRGKNVSP